MTVALRLHRRPADTDPGRTPPMPYSDLDLIRALVAGNPTSTWLEAQREAGLVPVAPPDEDDTNRRRRQRTADECVTPCPERG